MNCTAAIAAAFYHFATLPDYADKRAPLQALCAQRAVTGTILLAAEGVNGTIAGAPDAVRAVLDWLRTDPRLAAMEHKESPAGRTPFHRMKVRLKREIVSLGVPVDVAGNAGTYVDPGDWNALIDDPEVVLVDTRNDYEVAIGSFPGALNPGTRSFSELPAWVEQHPELRGRKIAMFCTGGIRCEKAGPLMERLGFRNVFQLDGGILRYFEEVGQDHYHGDCFVFDQRVAVDAALRETNAAQCYACQAILNPEEQASPQYVKNISCPYCYQAPDEELAATDTTGDLGHAMRTPLTAVIGFAEALLRVARSIPAADRTGTTYTLADSVGRAIAGRIEGGGEVLLRGFEALRPLRLEISAVEGAMRFDIEEFEVEAGREVEIVLRNPDLMPHNLVVTAPGSADDVGRAADAMAAQPDAYERGFVPDVPDVLFATELISTAGRATLSFTAPEQPGEYPYICTFPGHWITMRGVMRVRE